MFEDFGPANLPQPPAGALEQAISRGRTIRRQRRVGIITGVALSAALISGIVLINPLHTNKAIVVPADPHPVVPRDYSPIPTTPALSPQAETLDFGTLTKITTAGGIVTLHVDRAHFYMGDAAKAHNHGKTPLDDFILDDADGKKDYAFTLDPKASIQAEAQLTKSGEGDNLQRETLTQATFLSRMAKIESSPDQSPVLVWLRHTGGPDGPVVALSDQYIS
jgi:hypothetical protein